MGAGRDAWLSRVAALAFIVLWSTGYIAARFALPHCGPFTLLVLRFGAAALIFGGLVFFSGVTWPDRRTLLHSAVTGVLILALQFGGVYAGIRLGASAGVAALVIGAMPLTVSLMSLGLGIRIAALQWLGLAFGLFGVLLTLASSLSQAVAGLLAALGLVIGLIGISAGTLYQKRFASAIDLRLGLFVQNVAATVVLLPLAIGLEGFHVEQVPALYGGLAWMVLANSIATYSLLFVLIRRGEATKVAALFYLVPPVTAIQAHFVLHEKLTMAELAGFALAAFGVFLATRMPENPVNPVAR